jgi:hypothetical protein
MERRECDSSTTAQNASPAPTATPPLTSLPSPGPTAADALRLLAHLDDCERDQLVGQIIASPDAPLHDHLDMLLKACLHAMKSAVCSFVLSRDKPADGGRLWAANVLRQLKQRNGWGWARFYRELVNDQVAVQAVRVLSKGYSGGTLTLAQCERVRKAIRDLERHAKTKGEKAEVVYQLVLDALPAGFRAAFPGIESYLKLF